MALGLRERHGWGGKREGAGRPRTSRLVPHVARPALASRYPVHVTLRTVAEVGNLREAKRFEAVRASFSAGGERFGFRLVHYSVQSNHLHLLAEAPDADALRRGVQGLMIRIAKALNALLGRAGRVFSDRYHLRILRTPRETRFCLAYVLLNSRKHAHQNGRKLSTAFLDPCSSGARFDGWKTPPLSAAKVADTPLPIPRTWLMRVGWRRCGLIA